MADQAGGVVRSQGAAPSFTDYDLISDLIGLPADKLESIDKRISTMPR